MEEWTRLSAIASGFTVERMTISHVATPDLNDWWNQLDGCEFEAVGIRGDAPFTQVDNSPDDEPGVPAP